MENEIHLGHRQRMINKLNKHPDSLSDHELLEIFLYDYLPRINTNAIAHRLIGVFGSLEKVFSADVTDLTAITGIGEKTAEGIVMSGAIIRAIKNDKTQIRKYDYSSVSKTQESVFELFKDATEEKMLVVLLDTEYQSITQVDVTNESRFHVSYDLGDLIKALSLHKTFGVILCHNHPSGNIEPSDADDIATKKVMAVCSMHGVRFIDHLIVYNDQIYSYYTSGKLDRFKKETSVESIFSKL